MDLKVGSALRTSCVATAGQADEHKEDPEVEPEKRGSCTMCVGVALLVAMDGSSRSADASTQRMLRWKAANGVVVGRVVWCRPAEGVALRWTAAVEPLPVLPASRAPHVAQKQTT